MRDLVITLKNCPPMIEVFFQAAFKDAATHVSGKPLEITSNLEIDFDKCKEDKPMVKDLTQATNIFIMADSWIKLKAAENEG
jgi:hypothetical protein